MPDFGILAFGYSSKHGITRNPWNFALNPGSSSSGCAVSVAAGLNPAAIGTDIVGSVRLPASFCGLLASSHTRDASLIIRQTTRLCGRTAYPHRRRRRLADECSHAPDARDFTALEPRTIDYTVGLDSGVEGLRLGFVRNLGFGLEPDPEEMRLVEEAVELL
jgi:Asp-tRNA(Asn)/Glu-tRNA(Gln) amidotransferase A subunit family amidase